MKSKVILYIFLKVYAVLIACTNGADIPKGLSEHGHTIEKKLHQGNFEGENKKIQREKLFVESAIKNKGDMMKSQGTIKRLEKKFNKNAGLRKVIIPNKHRKMEDKIDVHKMENDGHLNTLRETLYITFYILFIRQTVFIQILFIKRLAIIYASFCCHSLGSGLGSGKGHDLYNM